MGALWNAGQVGGRRVLGPDMAGADPRDNQHQACREGAFYVRLAPDLFVLLLFWLLVDVDVVMVCCGWWWSCWC